MLRPTTDVLRIHARLVRQAAVCATAAAVLTACGGGGSSPGSAGGPQMTIAPLIQDRGQFETPDQAVEVPLGVAQPARIDFDAEEGGDTDWFQPRVSNAGTHVVDTEGNVPTIINVFESDGETPIPGMPGSWMGHVSQRVIDEGGIKVKITGFTEGRYTLTVEHVPLMSPMSPP